jgi:hypothetical protein
MLDRWRFVNVDSSLLTRRCWWSIVTSVPVTLFFSKENFPRYFVLCTRSRCSRVHFNTENTLHGYFKLHMSCLKEVCASQPDFYFYI